MSNTLDLVEYSVMYQANNLQTFGVIWDVSPELDPDTAAQYVLLDALRQAEEEDLEVLAMARANKTIHRFGYFYDTQYTSKFEQVDIYAPLFDNLREKLGGK